MELMTIKRAAKKLGLCEITLRKRIVEEKWPFYHLGPKGVRVDVEEVLRLTRRPAELKYRRKLGESPGACHPDNKPCENAKSRLTRRQRLKLGATAKN